jgi:hypothetical protein
MSNAMKKLKLLHHLTAASANATTSSGALPASSVQQQQQQQLAPTSPLIPHTNIPSAKYNNNYMEMTQALRSARHALNMLNPSPVPAPTQPPRCLLPQAFMVLTPNDPHPAICLPASPPPPQLIFNYHHSSTLLPPIQINPPIQQVLLSEQAVPRGNNTIYSSRPPAAPSPPVVQYHAYQNSQRRNSRRRPRLTAEAVSQIGKDTRQARWERVVSYVFDQHKTNPALSPPPTSSSSSSGIIKEIEFRNSLLDQLDVEAQAARSLWSGGSGGTNGVDQFVWSEDDDDDDFRRNVESQAALDDHRRRLDTMFPDEVAKERDAEVGVFELDDQDAEATVKDFDMSITKARPRSSPLGGVDAKTDGMKEYLDMLKTSGMPPLRRECELEGGLERLVARDLRRFSAVY